jgi:oligoribonuclease
VTDPLLWLDLETTGADETRDAIIEVGVIPTTPDLIQLGEWSEVVRPTDQGLGRLLRLPVVRQMHEANGLLDDLLEDDRLPTIGKVDHDLVDWLTGVHPTSPTGMWVLAGSGVGHFDRRFIKAHMPKLDRRLRHWAIDVGVLRRAYALWGVDRVEPPVPAKNHRALDDAYGHLAEARTWAHYFDEADRLLGAHT